MPAGVARALHVRTRMGLSQEKFSRIVGVKVRTLSKLEKGQEPSEQVRRKITEAERLQHALEQLVRSEAIPRWMQEPNKAFEGARPIDLIERGEVDRIWAMIYHLRSGSPA